MARGQGAFPVAEHHVVVSCRTLGPHPELAIDVDAHRVELVHQYLVVVLHTFASTAFGQVGQMDQDNGAIFVLCFDSVQGIGHRLDANFGPGVGGVHVEYPNDVDIAAGDVVAGLDVAEHLEERVVEVVRFGKAVQSQFLVQEPVDRGSALLGLLFQPLPFPQVRLVVQNRQSALDLLHKVPIVFKAFSEELQFCGHDFAGRLLHFSGAFLLVLPF
eukprot:11193360-Lingulodinium_polyedra.AAC.1